MEIKHAIISFWYKELEYNPICKVNELENSLSANFKIPFLINEKEPFINISMPRIVAQAINNQSLFNMSLVNMNLDIRFGNEENDCDSVILYINEQLQLLYDVLKEIYNLDILYTSIKVEMVEVVEDIKKIQKELLKDSSSDIEDCMIKKGLRKDNKYYVNEVITTGKEVNFDLNIPKNVKPNEGDMVARSMLVSLKNARVGKEAKTTVLEINDRLSYNNNPEYRVDKDSLRDLLFEFRMLVNKKIKD